MGNSVGTQSLASPSHVWVLLLSQLNGESTVPYDSVSMKTLAKMELEVFKMNCKYLKKCKNTSILEANRKYNLHHLLFYLQKPYSLS